MKPIYRKGVNAFIVDTENNFLIVQKNSYANNEWDMPGGGIEDNESPKTAMLRELEEELGTSTFEIISESKHMLKYDWPKDVVEDYLKNKGKHYLGQEKHQFLVRFTGNKTDITIRKKELKDIKWVPYEDLKKYLIFDNQWDAANKVIKDFKSQGLLE